MAERIRLASAGALVPALAAFLLAATASPSWSQLPAHTVAPTTRLMPVSGVLTDGRGRPMSGRVTVSFELYDAREDGVLLWTETQQVEADARGRYTAYLGASAGVPQEAFSSEQARWLGVRVGGRELPRMMLVAVPYALRAADAATLGGQPASSFVRSRADGRLETSSGVLFAAPAIDGSGVPGQIAKFNSTTSLSSSVISETATNRIGFGLTDPTGGGVVDSVFTIRNFDNNTGFGILNQTQQRRFAINTLASGGWAIYDGGTGGWTAGLSQVAGRVGIGNNAPQADLHLKSVSAAAIARLDGPVNVVDGPRLRWTEATVGPEYEGVGFEAHLDGSANKLIFRSFDGSSTLTDNILVMVRSGGAVGLGTVTPADQLHVAGDIRVGTGTTGCVKDADATVIAGTCSSDRRLKKAITPFGRALEQVASLQPVHFYWRADEYADRHFGTSESFGLIAQDVEKILPELVTTDEKGYKAVRYHALPMHMLQAIKDLKSENDGLRQRLEQQEERLRRLEEGRR